MTTLTGRTSSKFVDFIVGDSSNVLRSIPINSLSAVGVVYDTQDLTAFQDAVRGNLTNMPDAPLSISGPFDTSAAATAGTLSGSHTILSALNGSNTPRSVDIRFGIRAANEADSPQFGITRTATSGYIVTSYIVDVNNMTYTAELRLIPGSSLPAWGTTAETGS